MILDLQADSFPRCQLFFPFFVYAFDELPVDIVNPEAYQIRRGNVRITQIAETSQKSGFNVMDAKMDFAIPFLTVRIDFAIVIPAAKNEKKIFCPPSHLGFPDDSVWFHDTIS